MRRRYPTGSRPFYLLEAEGFDLRLDDARQVRHLPGRPKRDQSGLPLAGGVL